MTQISFTLPDDIRLVNLSVPGPRNPRQQLSVTVAFVEGNRLEGFCVGTGYADLVQDAADKAVAALRADSEAVLRRIAEGPAKAPALDLDFDIDLGDL